MKRLKNMIKVKSKKFKAKLKAKSKFDKKIASKSTNIQYYKAQAKNITQQQFIDAEKARLATPKWDVITKLLNDYKQKAQDEPSSTGLVLQGIFNKNKAAAQSNSTASNQKLLSIIAKPETLLLAYKAIKGNKGAMTQGAEVDLNTYNNMSKEQKILYLKSLKFPDGIDMYSIQLTAQLLQKGLYPWGMSKRIYFDKPGQPNKKRPITIPPFMDRIVQKAIALVLEAIYEPYFEKMNRSFGFRPNKGVHDAITALTSKYNTGMKTAIEGDIEAAFDSINKNTLLKLLTQKIRDKKFIKLLKQRLHYRYFEVESGKIFKPTLGIPQGGIDSPYLFNIYMYELDKYIHNELKAEVNRLNKKVENKRVFSKTYNSNRAEKKKYLRALKNIKSKLKTLPQTNTPKVSNLKTKMYKQIKKIRLNEHHKNQISSATTNKKNIRIFYARYADDWILLTNGDTSIANHLKTLIAKFLKDKLQLNLSENKTLITNITKTHAKFLGFELKISARGQLYKKPTTNPYKKHTLSKKAGLLLWAQPERQRLIDRYHTKGLCTKSGFPISMSWLSGLEAHVIIERYNAILRGVAYYFLPVIRNRAKIHRWIYIIRFSCLKTLAQKYNTTIKKVFKRFGYNQNNPKRKTVSVQVQQQYQNQIYYKNWTLLTYKDLISEDYKSTKRKLEKVFWDRENGIIGDYIQKKGKMPNVTNTDFLETISWVSWRTIASINMPCAYCGCIDNVQQHHIKAIRKREYKLIPEPESYQKIMALRNRKQIPLCTNCHRQLVHGGKYNGPKLTRLAPITKLVDNRIIHVESFVKPGNEYYAKNLEEKGWKLANSDNSSE